MTTSDPNACVQCGLCNTVDPIASVIRKESAGTRFKAVLAKQGKTNPLFYMATDVTAQEAVCPAGIQLGEVFRLCRERNVASGVTTKANEEMLANFRTNGTPYPDMRPEEFVDKPVW